ncbi:YHYH protein [Lewinella sp. 4G2]|uniref:YHYH protein n=1 Tax=Lewinella sp. 4G2 TaxID=1803372 RepID=UPI0007B47706|nr:YHYH protein [Lewinella sp. 4G2]OAV45145.1 hypothetical protein A3850_011875 [Lewinella sp. 4G2]
MIKPISGLLFALSLCTLIACNDDDGMACTESTWYQDADGDGLGNPDVTESACEQPEGFVADNTDTNDAGGAVGTPISAFDEFNQDAVTISFDGDEINIETTGIPNHTSPYFEETDPLYISPVVAAAQTPGRIGERNLSVTLPASPELAASSTATGLGPIGISVTGVPIFNDTEGPNRPLELEIAETFDYAGAHNGPSGYHYHVESMDVPENTVLSHDDEKLVGIMADGFLIYGRRCSASSDYPGDLDESGGHSSATQHSSGQSFYHYHIINELYIGNLIVLFGVDLKGTPSTIM